MTLALPKIGMRTAHEVGALSWPTSLFTAPFGASPPDFSSGSILAVER